MATMKDVAKHADVSISTVSFVLNGTGKQHKISDDTIKKVLKSAKELGYHLNKPSELLQHNMKTNNSINLFFPKENIEDELGLFLESIYKYLLDNNLLFNIIVTPYTSGKLLNTIETNSSNDISMDVSIVVISNSQDIKLLEKSSRNYPLIILNGISEKYSSVSCNTIEACNKLCETILVKGHKEICVIKSNTTTRICNAYFYDLLELCKKSGILIKEENSFSVENSFHGGAVAAHRILNKKNSPPLILSMNTTLSIGAIPVLARNKLYIPYNMELATLGLDSELSYLKNHIPSLSTIAFPLKEMCLLATEMALQISENTRKKPTHRICKCELVLNESLSI